jgi:hypothetical protein
MIEDSLCLAFASGSAADPGAEIAAVVGTEDR